MQAFVTRDNILCETWDSEHVQHVWTRITLPPSAHIRTLAGLEIADLPPADDAVDAPVASGATGGGSREDLPTFHFINISEDTQESDLRELFGTSEHAARVHVGCDREKGIGKGSPFVSFDERAIAQRAMEKLNGKGVRDSGHVNMDSQLRGSDEQPVAETLIFEGLVDGSRNILRRNLVVDLKLGFNINY
ncbi:hypothetical protein EV702DRAFT_1194515 [Suillus placidus]|uniref:RRM domain-containing protein n=1 Tax=Suillus placidus TaxID=48579 RepID=A0A9P7D4W4_9AGAM|nr:hypothetical protein EV702DRAFT_1194515 [Suillus placidus]